MWRFDRVTGWSQYDGGVPHLHAAADGPDGWRSMLHLYEHAERKQWVAVADRPGGFECTVLTDWPSLMEFLRLYLPAMQGAIALDQLGEPDR